MDTILFYYFLVMIITFMAFWVVSGLFHTWVVHNFQKYVISYGLVYPYTRENPPDGYLVAVFPAMPNDIFIVLRESILKTRFSTFRVGLMAKLVAEERNVKILINKWTPV